VFALLLWGPTLLYSRMHEKAIRTHAIGALTVGLGLTGVFGYFVGVPPIPRNAQAGIGLLLFSAAGLVLYLLVLGTTVVQHVWGSSGSG
jgi:polyferredoxin